MTPLLSILQKISGLSDPVFVRNSLEFVHSGVRGPLRRQIFQAIRKIEGGTEASSALEPLKASPHLEQTNFVEADLEERINARVSCFFRSTALMPPSHFERAARWEKAMIVSFMKVDPTVRKLVCESFRAYQERQNEYLLKKYHSNEPASFRAIAEVFLEDVKKVKLASVKGLLLQGERYFPIKDKILRLTDAQGNFNAHGLAFLKIVRLETVYGLKFPEQLTQEILEAQESFEALEGKKPINIESAKARLAAAVRALPASPRWTQELVAHFFRYRTQSADDFGFILRTARLLQRVSTDKALENGFTHHEVFVLEETKFLSRKFFRAVSIRYGIPYRSLADAYRETVYPDLKLRRLVFFRSGTFFEKEEIGKIGTYLRKTPTLGERLFFERIERDWDLKEASEAIGVDLSDYQDFEANKGYPSLPKLQKLGSALEIPLEDLLRLILKTYHPNLNHPRLKREPIYINYGESGDEDKLVLYQKNPGTFGENVFFARKKKLLGLAQLAGKVRMDRDDLTEIEFNRKRTNPSQMRRLQAYLEF